MPPGCGKLVRMASLNGIGNCAYPHGRSWTCIEQWWTSQLDQRDRLAQEDPQNAAMQTTEIYVVRLMGMPNAKLTGREQPPGTLPFEPN
jgi:hypothetical protein